jgi:pre-mRNA-processing factor 40
MLTAFESIIKSLEKTFNDARQQQKNQKARRERHNRDRFLSLLHELKKSNKIKAGAKWSSIHPLIETDERYTAMLGQSGSAPLDLFWDMLEDEERVLRSTRNDVLDVLDVCQFLSSLVTRTNHHQDLRFEVQQKTTFEEFLTIMQNDRRTANIDRDALSLIFERVRYT